MSWTKQSKLDDLGYGEYSNGDSPFGDIWGAISEAVGSWVSAVKSSSVWTGLTKPTSSWTKETKQSDNWTKI